MKVQLYKPTCKYMLLLAMALFIAIGYGIYVIAVREYYLLFMSVCLLSCLIPSMRNYELTESACLIRFWGIAAWIPEQEIGYGDIDQIIPYYTRNGKLRGIRINYTKSGRKSWVNVGTNIELATFYDALQKQCSLPN
ncbi:MAG: hypothetical protein RRZ66_07975 [Bacteroidales bacterium]